MQNTKIIKILKELIVYLNPKEIVSVYNHHDLIFMNLLNIYNNLRGKMAF